jgi:hypothetical protein
MAEHATAFILTNRFLPTAEVISEGLACQRLVRVFTIGRAGARRSSRRMTWNLSVFPDWPRPWIFVEVNALINHRLERGVGESVSSHSELLYNSLIA